MLSTLQIAIVFSIVQGIVVGSFFHREPEQGVFDATLGKNGGYIGFIKTAFNTTSIKLHVRCEGDNDGIDYVVGWYLRQTPCSDNYNQYMNENASSGYYLQPDYIQPNEKLIIYQKNDQLNLGTCGFPLIFWDESDVSPTVLFNDNGIIANRTARSSTDNKQYWNVTKEVQNVKNVVTTTWEDGTYFFIVYIEVVQKGQVNPNLKLSVHVEMESPKGFISAIDYPLLKLYVMMVGMYCLLALLWTWCLARQWNDLFGIHFWIEAAILCGLLEQLAHTGEYMYLNGYGQSITGSVSVLVDVLSCSVFIMLLVLISLGYGIVKPRLGPLLCRVLVVGALYGSLLVYFIRVPFNSNDAFVRVGAFTCIVLYIAIFCWICINLRHTTKLLRLHNYEVKLSLYRHFINTYVLCVLAWLIFTVWIYKVTGGVCVKDYDNLWVIEAYWQILSVIELLIIMTLWRPTASNLRLAFSPLSDKGETKVFMISKGREEFEITSKKDKLGLLGSLRK